MDRSQIILPVATQVRKDRVVGVVDLLALLRSGQHDFSTRKDEQHKLGHLHAEDKAREKFRLVAAHLCFLLLHLVVQRFKLYLKSDVVRCYDVLNAEVRHLDRGVAYLFNALCVPTGCLEAFFLALGTRAYHPARSEYQRSRSGLSDPHDGGCKALRFVFDVLAATRDVS
jgi:hypothetical protein